MIVKYFELNIVHFLLVSLTSHYVACNQSSYSECYDSVTGIAKKCMPEFTNAAYGLKIDASNTCGVRNPTEYCIQSSLMNSQYGYHQDLNINLEPSVNFEDYAYENHPRCDVCDSTDNRHSAEFLNDYNDQGDLTWWQSETMYEDVQYPNAVNLTLNLGKSFEINYVQIKFYSSRPESFAIYKKTSETSPWQAYQYYSASCERTYGKERNEIVKYQNEAIALCTDEFSDIAPMSGESIVFVTLQDRPSAYNFENSAELNEWVTATDIRITLNRLNTFGDEVFKDPQVLKSYYYAISGIAVGGRCKCYGHASTCSMQQQHDFEDKLACECKHFTTGINCEQCLPFYNDAPWHAASQNNANECKPCNCNRLSNTCRFNQTQYDQTGHGGYCEDCDGNTTGPHCQDCRFGTYRKDDDVTCTDCQCNQFGAQSLQCDPFGRCKCRAGVIGEKCDRCAPNHFDLSITGCKHCACNIIGSFDSPPLCDPNNGFCRCKANIEGQNCDRPKPGFFNLDKNNIHGALSCFCYGHSSQCSSSQDYFIHNQTASFIDSSNSAFKAVDSLGNEVFTYSVTNMNAVSVEIPQMIHEQVYFLLSNEFIGNQFYSYNRELSFNLELLDLKEGDVQVVRPSREDIVIESAVNNLKVYLPIYGDSYHRSGLPELPSAVKKTFTFKLHQDYGWMPTLTAFDFQRLLTNISSIKIRASYIPNTRTLLSNLILTTGNLYSESKLSEEILSKLKTAESIEVCTCPVGYIGQHCESCTYGYRRDPVNGGVYSRCVPCNCNYHADTCDVDTGKCECNHHTNGDNCEKCENGYYGNALELTEKLSNEPFSVINDEESASVCKKCPCPNNGACAKIYNFQLQFNEVVCLECPYGTQGNLCEICDDGHYNPSTSADSVTMCQKCECNGNIDENAIGNCDSESSTELCLRCVYNTTGTNCEMCLPYYWGDALSAKKCQACQCSALGTIQDDLTGEPRQCNLDNGQCDCKPNVKNKQCDECKNGFWNLKSNEGCEECKCNPLGSYNQTCNANSGQCFCRPGVQGLKCDTCQPLWFGYSETGCSSCDCDQFGTKQNDLQCDDFGQCNCRDSFSSLKCNKCAENRHNFTNGCLQCEDCYNLVQTRADSLREYIDTIGRTLYEMIESNMNRDEETIKEENVQLIMKLNSLKLLVEELFKNVFSGLKLGYSKSVNYLRDETKEISKKVDKLSKLHDEFQSKFTSGEEKYREIDNSLSIAANQFSYIETMNDIKKKELETIKKTTQESDHHVELQNLAKTARETADYQQKTAKELQEKAQKYINDAANTLRHLDDMIHGYERIEREKNINMLELDYSIVRSRVDGLVDEAQTEKKRLDKEVEKIEVFIEKLTEFKIPNELYITSEKMTKVNLKIAEEIDSKSTGIKNEVDNLKEIIKKFSNNDLLNSIDSAQSQLNSVTIKQKDIDHLLSIAESTKNKSSVAIDRTREIFENATQIYEALQRSDELVRAGKEKVAAAENLKPFIQESLDEGEAHSFKLKRSLEELNQQIENVKFVSDESVKIMKHTTSTFQIIENKSNDLKATGLKLDQEISSLNFKLEETEPKAYQVANLAVELNNRTSNVQESIIQIDAGTQTILDKSNNAFEILNKINKSISDFTLTTLSDTDIKLLELKFDKISEKLDENSELDETIDYLEAYSKVSSEIIQQFEVEIVRLKEQVVELDALNRTLKHECYSNTIFIPEL